MASMADFRKHLLFQVKSENWHIKKEKNKIKGLISFIQVYYWIIREKFVTVGKAFGCNKAINWALKRFLNCQKREKEKLLDISLKWFENPEVPTLIEINKQ